MALAGSDSVVSAWQGEQLLGLGNAISDGAVLQAVDEVRRALRVASRMASRGEDRAVVCLENVQ
jgi:hypothetical protein